MHPRIYIDTEFTTLETERRQLISLGAVSESGDEFYVEAPFNEEFCSDFTRRIVLPKLGLVPGRAMAREDACQELLRWLEAVRGSQRRVSVCYDYAGDWELMRELLGEEVPQWLSHTDVYRQRDDLRREEFFMRAVINDRPDADHHALYDARALRHACSRA